MVDRPLPENLSEKTAAREIYLTNRDIFEDRLILKCGEIGKTKALLKFSAGFQIPKFPVGGADLETLGIKPGVEMGSVLKDLEARWINSDFTMTKKELLKEVS